jgi:hypothetical protein
VAAILLWRGWPIANRILFGGLEAKRTELKSVQSQTKQKETEQMQVIRATARMKAWRDTSLPPNPLDGQRLYQQWLTDLALLAGWERPKVTPGRVAHQGNVFSAVQVQLDGTPNFGQLLSFLYHFHRTDLLHRVAQLSVTRPGSGDALEVTILAEGVSMQDAVPRTTLLPVALLKEDVSPQATNLTVDNPPPTPPLPFLIRMESEFARVVKVDGNAWTVQRGVDGTQSGRHGSGEVIEVIPTNPALATTSLAEYRAKFDQSLFEPFRNNPPQLARVRDQDAYFGRSLTFTARAEDPDSEAGQLRFRLRGAPQGAEIDSRTGEFRWTPDPSLAPRRYQFEIQVSDGGSPAQTSSRQVSINLHEDPAQSTFLTSSWASESIAEAWLHNTKQNQLMKLHKGETFRVADITGEVVEIADDYVIVEGPDGKTFRLRLGDNLRDMQPVTQPEAPPET